MRLRPTKNSPTGCHRYGIFGGTFDPVHLGHLIAAQAAGQSLKLDRIIFIPAGSPPHKRRRRVTEAGLRLRMVKLAIAGDRRFRVSDIELRSPQPSYTVATLKRLKQKHPGVEFYLLMGWDQAILLDTWRNPEEIFKLARVVLLGRPGYDPRDIPPRWRSRAISVEVPRVDISSSQIRRMVREGKDIKYLVPEAVERFIRRQGLYNDRAGAYLTRR